MEPQSNTEYDDYVYKSSHQYDHYIAQKMLITIYSIVFALGIIGNGLVILIAGFRMKNTINAVWFLHLAIADFLCCASLPLRIHEWTTYGSHIQDFAYCIVNIFLFNLNMTTSVLLLTAMSIDRWVSVMWPFWAKVHRTCNVVRISAAIIWGLSLTVTGLVLYLYIYHIYELNEWCVSRNVIALSSNLKQTVQLFRLLVMCVIPFLIIVTSYVTIFFKLRKYKKSQRSQRSSRIITAVISCFFICWFPYYIWLIIDGYYYVPFPLYFILHLIVTSLACLNSCMNPIIYVFMGPGFRQGFFRSIPTRVERALREHPNDLCREGEDAGNTDSTDV
ncbi:chemerin-like receptor 1 [Anomaloglossus baeobatrachus]|uniref:chemerin-like receptor 1 n=1 Tax=Anomaloglossus baeobatrachus TaxID=238106 RepID=UPI003F4FED5F